MTTNVNEKNHKKAIAIIVAIAILLIGVVFIVVSCTSSSQEPKDESSSQIETIEPEAESRGAENAPTDNSANDSPEALDAETEEQDVDTASESATDSSQSRANAPTAQSAGNVKNTTTQTPSSQKRWVEDTQRVWVEDKAAWTEQVPTYGTKEVSICNVCGQDITGNTSAHAKAHMMAGEGSGHHSEVQKVVTGYTTVNHPAEGHYEARVVGGHWE